MEEIKEIYIIDHNGANRGLELYDELIFNKKTNSFFIMRFGKRYLFWIDGKKANQAPIPSPLEIFLELIEKYSHFRAEKRWEGNHYSRFFLQKAPSYANWEAGRP